jgi:uncharacterized protein YhbP (UPF0306 family)
MSFPIELSNGPQPDGDRPESVGGRIKRLVEGQPYAVLCTQGQGQPYGSLVAYAMTEDLAHAVFATPRATRKFRLLTECDHVALLVDNRPDFPDQLMEIEAVTATGRASLVEEADDLARWGRLLAARHAYLSKFVQSSSCGLFRVQIVRYFHVSRFQEVRQWVPRIGG